MAPHPQRQPDAGDGNGGEPPEGVVAVPGRAHLEGRHLFQGGAAENRLPRLRRTYPAKAHGAVPADGGGAGAGAPMGHFVP